MKNLQISKKLLLAFTVIIISCLLLTACATQSIGNVTDPPGFFSGLFHGFIILFSFIGSFFSDYEIYAFPNAGGWYNFGFLLGVMTFFGGGGASSCKRK